MDYVDWVGRVFSALKDASAVANPDMAGTKRVRFTSVGEYLGFRGRELITSGPDRPSNAIWHALHELSQMGLVIDQSWEYHLELTTKAKELVGDDLSSLWGPIMTIVLSEPQLQVLGKLVEVCHVDHGTYVQLKEHSITLGLGAPWDHSRLTPILETLAEKNLVTLGKTSFAGLSTAIPTYAGVVRLTRSIPRPKNADKLPSKEQMVAGLELLSSGERQIIKLRFGLLDGKSRTRDEVAREFGVTRERLRQIEAKALRKLRSLDHSKKSDHFDKDTPSLSGSFQGMITIGTELTNESKPEQPEQPYQERNQVFISYSHKDKRWLDVLLTALKPFTRKQILNVWADTRIHTGDIWREEIEKALGRAKVTVLLVTQDFLASDFIDKYELPPLLEAQQNDGLVVFWIAVSASSYKITEIGKYQAANDPARPLDSLPAPRRKAVLVSICEKIYEAAKPQ